MKNSLLLTALVFGFFTSGAGAQDFQLLAQSQSSVEFSHTLNEFVRNSVMLNGYDYHNFGTENKVLTSEKGKPAIPFFSEAVQVPGEGSVSYEVTYDGFYEINDINILPSKGDLKRNVNPETVPYVFDEVYNQDAFYPGNLSAISEPYILRSTRGVNISLFPYQYNPVQKKLRIYQNMRVVVNTDITLEGANELHSNNTFKSAVYNDIYNHHYINALDDPSYTMIGETGSMLIITDENFAAILQPLQRWKNQSGIKTNIVTTAETGTTDTQIKSYIEDYYAANPDLVFVLLAGDSDKVPSHTYGNSWGEELWSDSYYGQITGGENDFYPELLVGRLSGNEQDMNTMVARILEYDKTPMEGDWMKNAIGIGSNEGDGYGNDGEADFQHLRNIRTQLIDYGYSTVYEFYQGSQGWEDAPGEPTPTMINSAMNDGTGLFNYTGHGWLEGMATGNYTNADVLNLDNNGKYPFVISVACNNGTFVNATTLGEAFLRATNENGPTGAIAFAGSSILMSWAPPMATQDEMTNILTEVYEGHRNASLGGLFYNAQIGMLTEYNEDGTSKEVMQTWILFGDPSSMFRYDTTQEITAQHADLISDSQDSFQITDCNAENGLATLSQGDMILGQATVTDGSASMQLVQNADMEGELPVLTIVKQNYEPYQAQIELGVLGIEDTSLNSVAIYPNPSSDVVNISLKQDDRITGIELHDMSGRVLLNTQVKGNTNSYQLRVANYQPGTYILTVHLNDKIITKKLIVR